MKMTLQNPDEIKIFILYLLDRIGYPLSFTDLGTVVIRDGIVDYFAYFEYFCELVEAGHVSVASETEHTNELSINSETLVDEVSEIEENLSEDSNTGFQKNGSTKENHVKRPTSDDLNNPNIKYVVTKTGRLIARSLSENILMAAVREKSYISAMRHLSLEKRGAVIDQTFERDGDGFIFHCSIDDKDGLALKLSVRADTVYQLNRMRLNFDERPDVVLRGVVALLTGNVNYLFEN